MYLETPPRFEDLHPQEAKVLMELSKNPDRKCAQWYFGEEGNYEVVRGKWVPMASSVGRNDPCACGSGKKFKKCCSNN